MQISALLRRSCAKEVAEEFKSALEDFETALNIDPNNHIIFFVRSKVSTQCITIMCIIWCNSIVTLVYITSLI